MSLFGFMRGPLADQLWREFALTPAHRRQTLCWLEDTLVESGVARASARTALDQVLPLWSEHRLDDGAKLVAVLNEAAGHLGIPAPTLAAGSLH